jgi:hypothetical protein
LVSLRPTSVVTKQRLPSRKATKNPKISPVTNRMTRTSPPITKIVPKASLLMRTATTRVTTVATMMIIPEVMITLAETLITIPEEIRAIAVIITINPVGTNHPILKVRIEVDIHI